VKYFFPSFIYVYNIHSEIIFKYRFLYQFNLEKKATEQIKIKNFLILLKFYLKDVKDKKIK